MYLGVDLFSLSYTNMCLSINENNKHRNIINENNKHRNKKRNENMREGILNMV